MERDLRDSVRKSVRILGDLEPRSELQLAIVNSLLDGPRTAAELTRLVLGEEPQDFDARYMRITRALALLESKGYVSRRILGKPKPYRLTSYALEKLGSLAAGDLSPVRLVKLWDIALYAITLMLASAAALLPTDSFWIPLLFVYLGGISTCRMIQTLRRVV